MATLQTNSTLPDSSNKQDFYDLVENSSVINIVNADISASAAIVATKLATIATAGKVSGAALTSLSSTPSAAGAIPEINLPNSIPDSHFATIATAGKVSGAALTSLSSTPSGAGRLPIANLASGTADGTKFIRDDGALAVPPQAPDYAAGDILLSSSDSTLSVSDAAYTKRKSIKIPRAGTMRIKFSLGNASGSGGTSVFGRIYRNGAAVGTERSVVVGGGTTEFSEDISGWSEQDEVQLYCKTSATSGDVSNFRIYADTVTNETVVYNA